MPMHYLFFPKYKLGKSQNDMLIHSLKYTFFTTLLHTLHIYSKQIVIITYFL